MAHFAETFTLGNTFAHWQYRGVAPAFEWLAGTTSTEFQPPLFAHWTGGCPARLFMMAMLRAVNIPVEYLVVEQHATSGFPTEGKYLSHGDDPYTRTWTRATPTVPASELLIDKAT